MKVKYQTKDGSLFNTKTEAAAYERRKSMRLDAYLALSGALHGARFCLRTGEAYSPEDEAHNLENVLREWLRENEELVYELIDGTRKPIKKKPIRKLFASLRKNPPGYKVEEGEHFLRGRAVCFTGDIPLYIKQEMVEKFGGRIHKDVSKSTGILVYSNEKFFTAKINKARELGVRTEPLEVFRSAMETGIAPWKFEKPQGKLQGLSFYLSDATVVGKERKLLIDKIIENGGHVRSTTAGSNYFVYKKSSPMFFSIETVKDTLKMVNCVSYISYEDLINTINDPGVSSLCSVTMK